MKLRISLAAAVASAFLLSPLQVGAGTIALPPGIFTYSKEGLDLSGTTAVTLPAVTVTVGNNLTYQDDIVLTLPGTVSLVPTITPGLATCNSGGGNILGYVSLVPGGWKFRVTDVNGVTIGTQCVFTGLAVTATSLSNTTGELNYVATRGLTSPVVVVDGPASTVPAILAKSQFDITVQQKLNAVINANPFADRKVFFDKETVPPGNLTGPDGHRADTLNFSVTRDGYGTTFTGPTVTPTLTTVLINGDFDWVDGTDDGPTCEPNDFISAVQGYTGMYTIGPNSNCRQLELTSPAAIGTSVAQGYFFVPGNVALDPTNWAGTVTWNYYLTSDDKVTGSTRVAWDPGEWTMNGAQVYIQYMPYGPGYSRIVYVANRGLTDAVLMADITFDGATFSCAIGVAPSLSVTNLSEAIDSCVASRGITSGRVAILLSFTAPTQYIEVYSAYNAGGSDRAVVVNTSNGRSFFYGRGTGITFP